MRTKPSTDGKDYSRRIRELRGARTQREFAELCGVGQSAVSQWESGDDVPTPSTYIRLAAIANEPLRTYFWEQSGLSREAIASAATLEQNATYTKPPRIKLEPRRAQTAAILLSGEPQMMEICLLRNAMSEEDVDYSFPFPSDWLPQGGRVIAVRAIGETAVPIVSEGDIVLIDVSRRDPRRLVDEIVAERAGRSIKVKWLRELGGMFVMLPHIGRPPEEVKRETKVIQGRGDQDIMGAVVGWISMVAGRR